MAFDLPLELEPGSVWRVTEIALHVMRDRIAHRLEATTTSLVVDGNFEEYRFRDVDGGGGWFYPVSCAGRAVQVNDTTWFVSMDWPTFIRKAFRRRLLHDHWVLERIHPDTPTYATHTFFERLPDLEVGH